MNPILGILACSSCRTTMVVGGGEAASWSIFFLLIVILAMMGSIGFFMIRLGRREKRHFDPSLSDNYIHPGPSQ